MLTLRNADGNKILVEDDEGNIEVVDPELGYVKEVEDTGEDIDVKIKQVVNEKMGEKGVIVDQITRD